MARAQKRKKAKVLEALAEMPIVEAACKKAGVSRASYYRWLKEDDNFQKEVGDAMQKGDDRVNGLAESKIVTKIQDGDMRAITYWLNNRSHRYGFPKRSLDSKKPGLIERAVTIFDMRLGKKKKLVDDDD
jgi:hypothetical protein